MAGFLDFVSLILFACVFVGAIVGIIWVIQQIQESVKQTKESLGKKGLHITPSGLSVKTDKRFDREDYIDATQRGIIKTMGAASFGQVDEKGNHLDKGIIERKMSGGSSPSLGNGEEKEKEKEKKSRFGLRRGLSGSK